MKKSMNLFLAVLMVILAIPLSAYAETTAIRLYDFDDGTNQGISATYSDWQSGLTLSNYPQFVANGSDIVYDTHAAVGTTPENTYVTGTTGYPIKSSGAPAYMRINLEGGNNVPMVSSENNELYVHTYETLIRFDSVFPYTTTYQIRYGDQAYLAGTTKDVNLFEVTSTGMLKMGGTDRKQLALAKTYKVSVVVDVRGETRKAQLFLDETYIAEYTSIAVADESIKTTTPANYKKAVFSSIIVRPYTGSGTNYSWIGTKVSLDDIKVLRGTDYQLPSATVSLKAESNFKKSPNNETTHSYVKAFLNGNADEFIYSQVGGNAGVTVSNSGKLTVAPTAVNGDKVIIKAALKSDPSIYNVTTVTIASPFVYTFETGDDGWKANTAAELPILRATSGGNTYLEPQGKRVNSPALGYAATVGKATVEFKMMANAQSGDIAFAACTEPKIPTPNTGKWYLDIKQDKSTSPGNVILKTTYNTNKINFITAPMEIWIDMKFVIDFGKEECDIFAGGEMIAQGYKFDDALYDFKLSSIYAYAPMDDVKIYSGASYENIIVTKDRDQVLIPSGDKATIIKFQTEDTSLHPVWSLVTPYSGVSINSQTGLFTVTSDAAVGTVTVKATADEGFATINIPLKKYFFDFENITFDSKWTDASILEEDGNKAAQKASGKSYIRYQVDNNIVKGRFVVEADMKLMEGQTSGSFGVAVYNQTDWINFNQVGEEFTNYKKVRIIADTNTKTYTAMYDGALVPGHINSAFTVNEGHENDVFIMKQFITNMVIDNFAIYDAALLPPVASVPKIGTLTVGGGLNATYSYFSEPNYNENCTDISWFVSDTIDGTYTSVSEDYILTADDFSKFYKVSVTPKSANDLVGATVISAPVCFTGYKFSGILINNNQVAANDNLKAGANTFTVSLKFANSEETKKSVYLVAAYYQDNKMIALDMDEKEIEQYAVSDLTVDLTFNIASLANENAVKLFVWDGVTLQPIISAIIE